MKKTALALAVAVASITTVANAALPENTWYTGGKFGWSNFQHVQKDKVANTDKVTKNRVGVGAFLGYQATPYLAAELGYDWLGNVEYKTSGSNRNAQMRVHGFSFTGKASYPLAFISEDLDIYGRFGAFIHNTKWKDGSGDTFGDTDVSPVYALGLDYRVNEDFGARLEYQWLHRIKNYASPVKPNNGFLTFGVTYRLGSPSTAKPAEFEYINNRYVLNEDILFTYAKATLKDEGKEALDQLVATLVKINPTESAIVVIGHTDPIGSASYNQKLSDQRAQTVMNYLVSKGVPADLISARGVGKTQPVTGDTCNGLKGAELISCYAPDRRVEIEIKAQTVEEVLITEKK